MITLGSVTWGSGPGIPLTFAYEKQRSGADMQYRVKITVSPIPSTTGYFGYPIYWSWTINGTLVSSYTLKAASPKTWTSAITYTTPWYTVKNKTTGTTSLKARVYSGSGSSRDSTYSYSMGVDPAASAISASNGTLGTSLALKLTRYNSAFTDTITYTCGSASGTVVSGATSATVNWTTGNGNTVALSAQNTSGQSVNVTFRVSTYSGSTLVGSNSVTISMSIPTSVKPSVALKVEDASGYLATYGAYVQGYSKLKITATPTLAYGSAIKSYEIKADGGTYTSSSVTTNAVKGTGTLAVTAKVTDHRTRPSDPVTSNITVLAYSKPKVTVSAYRCNSSGTADAEGAYMKIVVTSTISSLNSKNTATYKVVHPGGTVTGNGTNYTSGVLDCDVSSVHNIEVTITDKLSSTTKAAVIPVAFTLMDYYNTGKGVAFGKIATRNGFDVAMPAYFTGGINIDGQQLDYIVEQGTSGIWSYRKWASGVAECWGKRSVDVPVTTTWGSLYNGTVLYTAFPFTFADKPYCTVTSEYGTDKVATFVASCGNASAENAPSVLLCRPTSKTTLNCIVVYHAYGKWK